MAERRIDVESKCAAAQWRVGAVTVLAIERREIHAVCTGRHAWILAAQATCAVIVRDANGLRAIGSDNGALSIAQLRHDVPGLDERLASL